MSSDLDPTDRRILSVLQKEGRISNADLAARINDPAFKAKTGPAFTQKLNLIRKLGNTAVHDATAIPAHATWP